MKKNMKNAGFTLMEAMIVVAIIAILAAISIPNFLSWRRNAELRAGAEELHSAVQLTKLRAVKERTNCVILFDDGDNSYMAFIDNGAGGGTATTRSATELKRSLNRGLCRVP